MASGWPAVYGGIADHYYEPSIRQGLGCPTTWEYDGWDGNREQEFQGGFMHWNRSTARSYATWGDIARKWREQCGGLNGVMGPPTRDEYDSVWCRDGCIAVMSVAWLMPRSVAARWRCT